MTFKELKPKDKVVIVSKRGYTMSSSGEMDKYLGQTVTIREVDQNSFLIEEDRNDRSVGGWSWIEKDIDWEKTNALYESTGGEY